MTCIFFLKSANVYGLNQPLILIRTADLQKYSGIAPVTERSGKKTLGTLALAVPDIPSANIYRMGSTDDQQIFLGGSILSTTTCKRLYPLGSCASLSV